MSIRSLLRKNMSYFIDRYHQYQARQRGTSVDIFSQAKSLNEQLHSDVSSIPPADMQNFTAQIGYFCRNRQFSDEYTQLWMLHKHRLYLTVQWLKSISPQDSGQLTALDLGEMSPSSDLFDHYLPNVSWTNTTSDLRYQWPYPDDTFDLMACTELLEHVSDLPEGLSDTFFKTGLKALLKEMHRVLKPGGRVLITTPNAGSILHFRAALDGYAPWFYTQHVREYTIGELSAEIAESGLTVERCQTLHCLTAHYNEDYSYLFEILLRYQRNTNNRGDDIFLIAKK